MQVDTYLYTCQNEHVPKYFLIEIITKPNGQNLFKKLLTQKRHSRLKIEKWMCVFYVTMKISFIKQEKVLYSILDKQPVNFSTYKNFDQNVKLQKIIILSRYNIYVLIIITIKKTLFNEKKNPTANKRFWTKSFRIPIET